MGLSTPSCHALVPLVLKALRHSPVAPGLELGNMHASQPQIRRLSALRYCGFALLQLLDFGIDRVTLFLADALHVLVDGVHEVLASERLSFLPISFRVKDMRQVPRSEDGRYCICDCRTCRADITELSPFAQRQYACRCCVCAPLLIRRPRHGYWPAYKAARWAHRARRAEWPRRARGWPRRAA
jgi:hypothetical protein